jgi:6-pyruvoyltetrahydropterin/6-carboxytetrahydropterin synthase
MKLVQMTRRVVFSSGHRYWFDSLSAEENHRIFGPWASRFNHGHNYVLDLTVSGTVDPSTGMVVNIKRVDDALKELVVSEFDQRSINDEIPYFQDRAPCLENLLTYIWAKLSPPGALPEECKLERIRLEEMPTFYGELDGRQMTLTRSYEFAASHRLHSPVLDQATNESLFGKCNNPAGHGHNYILEVTVTGELNTDTGMMTDLASMDKAVESQVVDRYDHKNLNEDLPEFQGKMTTTEIVAQEIFNRLQGNLPAKLTRIRLWETARNMFEVSAAG